MSIGLKGLAILLGLLVLTGCSSYPKYTITDSEQSTIQESVQPSQDTQTTSSAVQDTQATQPATDTATQTTTSPKYPNQCPDQGFMEDDVSYCVDICMVGRSDAQVQQDYCQNICDKISYYDSTEKFQAYIQKNKCSKCGQDC